MIMTIIFLFLLFLGDDTGRFWDAISYAGFMILVPIVIILLYLKKRKNKNQAKKEKEQVWKYYSDALDALKSNPTNADLNQTALAWGREYKIAIERLHDGYRIYPEESILNDINAACAGASNPQSMNQESIETRLAKLNSLKEKGLIDDQELQERRQQILKEI